MLVGDGVLHGDAVATLEGWAAPDAEQERLRAHYLRHLAQHADGVWRSSRPEHITASALVADAAGANVLLTLHKMVGRWLQLGGHCEPGDTTLADAALREAAEESGIEGLRLLPGPVHLDRHRVWCHGGSYHLDVQYVATAPEDARERISEESDDLRWFPIGDLPERTDDALRRLVSHARRVR